MGDDPLLRTYDAIVVGSGATGGWAAKKLSEAGLAVLLLDAGRTVSPAEFGEATPNLGVGRWHLPPDALRTRPVQTQCYGCRGTNYQWFVDDGENPYSTGENKPFEWYRVRAVGGRTLVWAGQSYRMSDADFQAAADGYGENWPLSYAELAPYYDEVEQYMGVSGQAESHPLLPDGCFLPPMTMTGGEALVRDVARARFGYTTTIGRTAILTRPHNGRAACTYCGPCERGCPTFSSFSSAFTTVPDALRTGRCTLVTNAMVAQVNVDPNANAACGVTFVDRASCRTFEVHGRTVVLCAQALESTRILLNSTSRLHPNGLGNSSGALGHYLMDHVTGAGAQGRLAFLDGRASITDPYRPNGIYVVRFRNVPGTPSHPKFIRGYALQGGASAMFNLGAPGFGVEYLDAVKQGLYAVMLGAFGESLPQFENYCEIDPELRDAWGIPALRIHMQHGPNELAMMTDAAAAAGELLEACGATDVVTSPVPSTPGAAIHEVGTARMGLDPKTSVLNRFGQLHDVPNVFVMDGACFVSSGCQNPTLTMMALAVRACDHLVERFRTLSL